MSSWTSSPLGIAEICRAHIYNQHKKNDTATVAELIDNTISNYLTVLKQLGEMGFRFCVYGVPPATKHVINYPRYATREMKNMVHKEFEDKYPFLAPPRFEAALTNSLMNG